jgi:hypothetical protein
VDAVDRSLLYLCWAVALVEHVAVEGVIVNSCGSGRGWLYGFRGIVRGAATRCGVVEAAASVSDQWIHSLSTDGAP